MANESQTDQDQIQNQDTGHTDDKTGASQSADSSSVQGELDKRLIALEAQLTREKDRNDMLEQSLKIQERYLNQQVDKYSTAKGTSDKEWSNELDILDKALDPVFKKRLDSAVTPVLQAYNTVRDENDAFRFEMFLQRNNPELLEDEDSYNKTAQQVEAIRQAGRERGMEISRVDAFVFNEGLQGTRQKISSRKQKRTAAATHESKRSAEVQAAVETGRTGETRPSTITGVQAIRDKANRGERLTTEERAKFKEYVSNVEF